VRAAPFKGTPAAGAWTRPVQADSRLAETDRYERKDYGDATAADNLHATTDRRAESTPRSSLHRRPILCPHHRPPPTFRPTTTRPPRRLDGSPTGSPPNDSPRPSAALLRSPPPRPLAHQLPPGLTLQVYLAGRGRGASATRWPPFLESPGGKRKTRRGRGGGPFALKANPYRRTPRDEQQETNSLGVVFLVSASEGAGAATRRAG
jgi:hypothetical protein